MSLPKAENVLFASLREAFEAFEVVGGWGISAVLVGGLGIVLISSIYQIDEGERGVLTRNGAFVSTVEPGLHFKIPFIEGITKMEVRNMRIETPVNVYSSDTQQYDAMVSVNFDLSSAEVERIFKAEGIHYAEHRLKPLVETTLKEVAGKYSAERTIQERDVFGTAVRDAIREQASSYGINVTEVQITNIDFTDQFERAIENAMLAKAKVEEERNILSQKKISAETRVVEATATANALREIATGEADAKRIQAEAEALRITQIGGAEAEAIRGKAESLRNNPELTAYTYSLAAQQWNGQLPNQFVPGSAVPFLNLLPSER